jgi:hypothetical protein
MKPSASPSTSTDTGSVGASWTRASKSSAHAEPLAPTHTQCITGVPSPVQRDNHEPGPGRTIESLDELMAVGQQHCDPIAFGQSEPGQHVGDAVGPLIEFGGGEPLPGGVVDERLQTRIQLGPLGQIRTDVHGCLCGRG